MPTDNQFWDGPDPVCRTMQYTVYSRSSTVWSSERLRLLNGDFGTSKAMFACDCMCFVYGGDKGLYVGIVGASHRRSVDTVLCVPRSAMVTVCD